MRGLGTENKAEETAFNKAKINKDCNNVEHQCAASNKFQGVLV